MIQEILCAPQWWRQLDWQFIFVEEIDLCMCGVEFLKGTGIVGAARSRRTVCPRRSCPQSKSAMRTRVGPLRTQNYLAPVLVGLSTAHRFKKPFVSITKSITDWTVGLAIIALFASACATPVGVTRLDEQAAHRELTANVLSAGKPSEYSTQILERTALSERFDQRSGNSACRVEFWAWQT